MNDDDENILTQIREALAGAVNLDTVFDLGEVLTCREAEAFTVSLDLLGLYDLANALLDGHALSDGEGDEPEHLERATQLRDS